MAGEMGEKKWRVIYNVQRKAWPKQAFPFQLSNTSLNIDSEHFTLQGPIAKYELKVSHAIWEKEVRVSTV